MPEVKMPVAVKANGDNFPSSFTVSAQRDSGSVTYTGLISKMLTNPTAAIYDKTSDLVDPVTLSVPEDGLDYFVVTFDEVVPNVVFSTSSETAPDVDLRILDATFTRIGRSAGATSDESVSFTNLPAGTYYVVVDGYEASTPGGTDEVLVKVSSIVANEESLSETVDAEIVENGGELELTINWEGGESIAGIVELSSEDDSYAVQIPVSVVRGQDDVTSSASLEGTLTPGSKHCRNAATFTIAPNFTNRRQSLYFDLLS